MIKWGKSSLFFSYIGRNWFSERSSTLQGHKENKWHKWDRNSVHASIALSSMSQLPQRHSFPLLACWSHWNLEKFSCKNPFAHLRGSASVTAMLRVRVNEALLSPKEAHCAGRAWEGDMRKNAYFQLHVGTIGTVQWQWGQRHVCIILTSHQFPWREHHKQWKFQKYNWLLFLISFYRLTVLEHWFYESKKSKVHITGF